MLWQSYFSAFRDFPFHELAPPRARQLCLPEHLPAGPAPQPLRAAWGSSSPGGVPVPHPTWQRRGWCVRPSARAPAQHRLAQRGRDVLQTGTCSWGTRSPRGAGLPVQAGWHRAGQELLSGPATESKNVKPGVCAVSAQREEQKVEGKGLF